MKILFILAITLSSTLSLAANSDVLNCKAVLQDHFNFYDLKTGLRQVNQIEISAGKPGEGGQGINVKLSGTAGSGNKAVEKTMALKWMGSFSQDEKDAGLRSYSNLVLDQPSDVNNPSVTVKMIYNFDKKIKNVLVILEVVAIQDTANFVNESDLFKCN